VPTESLSEKLSVQRIGGKLGLTQMRANVFTLAEGSMLRHLHREQEELYVVLDGTAMIDIDEATTSSASATRSSSRRAPGTVSPTWVSALDLRRRGGAADRGRRRDRGGMSAPAEREGPL